MDRHLQRIVDDARAEHDDDPAVNGFTFQPAPSRLSAFRYSPPTSTAFTGFTRSGGSGQSIPMCFDTRNAAK